MREGGNLSRADRREELNRAASKLIGLGVPEFEATALIGACVEDERRVLTVVALAGEPREGDRIRVVTKPGEEPQALRVLAAVMIVPTEGRMPVGDRQRYAVVGDPVEPSRRDDALVLPRGVRR